MTDKSECKTWTTVDKSEWPRGEWDEEADKAQWIDEDSGLDCLIVRGPNGALCGYVGVPESHFMYEEHYDAIDVDVHGGLTFANKCNPSESEAENICHTGTVANATVWWLGFDCSHYGDISPKFHAMHGSHNDSYRTFNYVKKQVKSLAAQLVA